MPDFRRLSQEEAQALRPANGRRAPIDLTEHQDFVRELAPGEGGEIALVEGDSHRTIKLRLTKAAGQFQKTIRYRSSKDGVIRFVVQE